jgi:transcriptional regulator
VPWTIAEMGDRYDLMVKQIVAFRAHVRRVRGRFKLGQDETPQTRTEVLKKLDNADLVRWMTHCNPQPAEESPGKQ